MNLVRFQKPAYMFTINDLLNDFMSDYAYSANRTATCTTPAVNVSENDNAYQMEFLAPGFEKENFSILNKDGVLTVKGEIQKDENKSINYTRKRFSIQPFERTFKLPEDVDSDAISAKYINGILVVELSKKEVVKEKSEKTITIQ